MLPIPRAMIGDNVKAIFGRLSGVDTTRVPIEADCDQTKIFELFAKDASSEETEVIYRNMLMGKATTVKHYHLLTVFYYYRIEAFAFPANALAPLANLIKTSSVKLLE